MRDPDNLLTEAKTNCRSQAKGHIAPKQPRPIVEKGLEERRTTGSTKSPSGDLQVMFRRAKATAKLEGVPFYDLS